MIAEDTVLVEILTAANMAGIEQANAGLVGFNTSTLALAAVLAGVVTVGRAAIENHKQQDEALKGLSQAESTKAGNYSLFNKQLLDFIDTNARYIDNQYDVITAAGQFIRAGVDQKTTMQLLNDALDLAALKHISVADASRVLLMATEGNTRGLRDLGFTSKEVTDILKDSHDSESRGAAIHDLVAAKLKDGRRTTDEYTQSQRDLNKHWQDFTSGMGPGVTTVLTKLTEALDTGVQILDLTDQFVVKLGNDQSFWNSINDGLVGAATKFHDLASAIGATVDQLNRLTGNPGGQTGPHYRTPAAATRQRGFILGSN